MFIASSPLSTSVYSALVTSVYVSKNTSSLVACATNPAFRKQERLRAETPEIKIYTESLTRLPWSQACLGQIIEPAL